MNIMRGIRVRVSCQFKLAAGGGNTGSCSTAQWSPHCQWSRRWLLHCTLYTVQATVSTIYLRYNGYPKYGKVMVTQKLTNLFLRTNPQTADSVS